jgi:hypothetical protein
MTSLRLRLVGIACAVSACLAGPARAQDDAKRACAAAFSSAQRLMRSGDLLEAKKKLVFCGGPDCPSVMHADCQQWLSNVEASMPTVVFQVSSATGAQPEAVRMSLDGAEAVVLDGRALSVNPGEHEAVFEASGFRTSSRRLVVSEGEKLRREVVVLEPTPVPKVSVELPAKRLATTSQPAKAPASRRLTVPVIVAASGAALAGAGAIYFGLKARSDDRDLDHCSPDCTRDNVDHVKRQYVFANLSIGLAVAGVTTAALLYVYSGKSSTSPTATVGLNAGPDLLGLSATGTF